MRRQIVRILRPGRDQAPARQHRAAVGQVRAGLAPVAGDDQQDRLRRRDVVARRKILDARRARKTLPISSGLAVREKRPHIFALMPLDSSGTRWRLETGRQGLAGGKTARHDTDDRTKQIIPAVSVALQHDDRLLLVRRGQRALARLSMRFPADASKRAKRWRKPRGANSPRKPGLVGRRAFAAGTCAGRRRRRRLRPAGLLRPLCRRRADGGRRRRRGRPSSRSAEMENLQMPISVLEVGRNLLGK